ncbi:hypothetical protein HYPSUDRAFT_61810 [Hypholoma sublateritium FD-334 SS-4]|uniref:N-acetyl-D-glucosamine kinase n=1 Tax=Hypholoma sublateritium (strain FD-334 SS-4) TaxID=945553 RepID=A0A0D2MXZ4_HYPSF|nr:hypothetical protein HYPSUDRAFT_61810 [Hypholoma sublateritium FD-334 SS-4]
MSLFLAVDCGGSKTAVAIADASGTIVARATGGPSNITYLTPAEFIANVSAAIAAALADARPGAAPTLLAAPPPFAAAWFGISGADSPAAIARVAPALSTLLGLPLGPRLALANDTSLLASPLRTHPTATHAVAAVAGTGSITVAFARGADGAPAECSRAGGWGWLLGDEGSGFAVGRAALLAVLRESDAAGPGPREAPAPGSLVAGVLGYFNVGSALEVLPALYAPDPAPGVHAEGSAGRAREKRISVLAPLVFAAAFDARDPLALRVVEETAGKLAEQLVSLLLCGDGRTPIDASQTVLCFGGSLAGVDAYRALIVADLARRGHVFLDVVFVGDPAATGASGLASAFGGTEQ